MVESILWDDKKVTTYKFALLRAIANLAVHRPRLARWEGRGRVSIPMDAIIDLWIRYYWPFMQTATQSAITQGHSGEKADMGFRAALTELAVLWQEAGGYAAFETDLQQNRLSKEVGKLLATVRAKVRTAVKKPIRHAGNDRTGHGMFEYESLRVHLPESIWRESALLGRWIEDSLIIRWAEFTTQRDPSLSAEQVLHRLLQAPALERNTDRAKRAYEAELHSAGLDCAWSGEPIKRMHVDHALPWSLWRSNDLWNLLPVESAVNSEKGARLPSRTRVESRRSSIISSWEILFEAEREIFLAHARSFVGTDLEPANARDFGRAMQSELFAAFKDALEYTAVNRGVARW